MIHLDDVPALFRAFQARWTERDDRMFIMDEVVKGDWEVAGLDDNKLENRSPNLIQVALEDTAESASLVPSPSVIPGGSGDRAKRRASAMERMAVSYMDASQIELLEIQSNLDLGAFGFFVWVVTFDRETGSPVIEWRDPRTCYPENGWRSFDSVRTAMFAKELYVRQLSPEWQSKVTAAMHADGSYVQGRIDYRDHKIILLETFEEDVIQTFAMYAGSGSTQSMKAYVPVLLDSAPTPGGICPVVIGQRPTLDSEPRGQFDQVVAVMLAHIRLMGMVLDYADQAVYSDIWVKDLVGQMAWGGGSYISLGPNGAIGRVPPAVSSLSVYQELETLVNNVHLGGRWPKSRPGEIDQAIASAKFIEATAGMMNTVIRTFHLVMKRALEQALRICFKVDAALGADRVIAGVRKNHQFLSERLKDDIDLSARVMVDYGVGLGHDPAQAMVLAIQGMQTGMFSKEFAQENFQGLSDVARENERIDQQSLRDMAFAQLLEGLQTKTIPPMALVKIYEERGNGRSLMELFKKYIAEPEEEAMQSMIPSGMGGPGMQPGTDPMAAMMGAAPPSAPPPEELLGALAGGGAPPQTESIGRLSQPLPGGGFAGTQTTAGGA